MAKKKTSPTAAPETKAPAPRRRAPARRAAADARGDGPAVARAHAADPDRDPTFEEIAEAAYRRYLSRGGVHGRDFDDWLEAERELRSRR